LGLLRKNCKKFKALSRAPYGDVEPERAEATLRAFAASDCDPADSGDAGLIDRHELRDAAALSVAYDRSKDSRFNPEILIPEDTVRGFRPTNSRRCEYHATTSKALCSRYAHQQRSEAEIRATSGGRHRRLGRWY
jgi:hypothetical protein